MKPLQDYIKENILEAEIPFLRKKFWDIGGAEFLNMNSATYRIRWYKDRAVFSFEIPTHNPDLVDKSALIDYIVSLAGSEENFDELGYFQTKTKVIVKQSHIKIVVTFIGLGPNAHRNPGKRNAFLEADHGRRWKRHHTHLNSPRRNPNPSPPDHDITIGSGSDHYITIEFGKPGSRKARDIIYDLLESKGYTCTVLDFDEGDFLKVTLAPGESATILHKRNRGIRFSREPDAGILWTHKFGVMTPQWKEHLEKTEIFLSFSRGPGRKIISTSIETPALPTPQRPWTAADAAYEDAVYYDE